MTSVEGASVSGRDCSWRGALIVLLLSCALYAALAIPLASGRLLRDSNLAFDYDPSRYVELYTGVGWKQSGAIDDTYGLQDRIKHPLVLALRPVALLLIHLGFSTLGACIAITVFSGSLAAAAAWCFLRAYGVAVREAALATICFACSATQLLHSIVPESYAPAAASVALAYVLWLLRRRGGSRLDRAAVPLSLATFGITSTNLAFGLIAELGSWWERKGLRAAILRTIWIGSAVALVSLLALSLFGAFPWRALLSDPVDSVRQVWWTGKLKDDLPKAGVVREALTFWGYSFVAPETSTLPIEQGAKTMVDFRQWDYSPAAAGATIAWLCFCAAGALRALSARGDRWLAACMLASLVFQIALHTQFQFRQSLFLVASHSQFAVLALNAPLLKAVGEWSARARSVFCALAGLVVLVAAWNNIERVLELVRAYAG